MCETGGTTRALRTLSVPVSGWIVPSVAWKVQHFVEQGLQHHVVVGPADQDDPHWRVAAARFTVATENVGFCVRFQVAAPPVGEVAKAVLLRTTGSLHRVVFVAAVQALKVPLLFSLSRRTLVTRIRSACPAKHHGHRN
jgi:hypothetical protein